MSDTYPRALLVAEWGQHEFRRIETYRDIQAAVGGNFDWLITKELTFYVYEYSLYERPVNPLASRMSWAVRPELRGVPLAGPVLVLGPAVHDDDTDVPQKWVDWLVEKRERWGPERIGELAQPLSQKVIDRLKLDTMEQAMKFESWAADQKRGQQP